jgi:hypothetical protein
MYGCFQDCKMGTGWGHNPFGLFRAAAAFEALIELVGPNDAREAICVYRITFAAGTVILFRFRRWAQCFYLHKSISNAPVHSGGSAVYALYGASYIRRFKEAWFTGAPTD